MTGLNMANINLACSRLKNEKDRICNVKPINETKGFANRITFHDVHALDWTVFLLYFAFIIIIGLFSAFRNPGSIRGFFLTARSANWVLIGLSMFASNIGSGQIIGLPGSAVTNGITAAIYELNAVWVLPLLGWLFAPVYLAANVSTMPEYLRARFGGRRIQIYVACNALFMYIFTKISADLYSGKIYLTEALDFHEYAVDFLLLAFAAFFTIIGGMNAVLWTNAVQVLFCLIIAKPGFLLSLCTKIQVAVILMGSCYLTAKAVSQVGGLEALYQKYLEAKPDIKLSNFTGHSSEALKQIRICGKAPNPDDAFHFFHSPSDTVNAPWPGTVFGVTILSIWYWCIDQIFSQHVLASKNLSHAKLGCLLTAALKFLPSFLFVLPGMAARVLYSDVVACSDPVLCCCFCGSKAGCTNYAYTALLTPDFLSTNATTTSNKSSSLIPPGARGLMAITVSAAVISSFTVLIALPAIFTMDIWRLIRPKASARELKIVGRVYIIIVCTVSMLWMVIVNNQQYLLDYMQSMTSYFSPPLTAVFLLAIFWKRCNEQGAFYGLMIGVMIGALRYGLDIAYSPLPSCAETRLAGYDLRPPALRNVHFLYFALILFGITTLVTVCLSLVTKPPDKSRINGLTYWTRYEHRIMRRPKVRRNSTDVSTTFVKGCGIPGEHSQFIDNRISTTSVEQLGEEQRQQMHQLSKWRNFVNWICGIESRPQVNDASVGGENVIDCEANSGRPHGLHLLPISSGLFEEPRMRMICWVALIGLMTFSLFIWVLFI